MADDELWESPAGNEEEEEDEASWQGLIDDEEEEARWESPLFDEEEPDEIPQELLLSLDADEDEAEEDLTQVYHYDTQHGDGHTYDVGLALDQGLTYTPPTDPPTMPSADGEGLEVATGFGLSMEDSNLDAEALPEGIDNNDLDLEEDVYEVIRFNSETQNLSNVRVRASNGVVALFGTVPDDQDMERLVDLVEDMEGVQRVLSHLRTEEVDEGGIEE